MGRITPTSRAALNNLAESAPAEQTAPARRSRSIAARWRSTRRAMGRITPTSRSELRQSRGTTPQDTNRPGEAEPLFRRALAIFENELREPDHPKVAIGLNNLAQSARKHEPPRRGRAAVSPRAGDRRGELRAGSSRSGDRPQQSRESCSQTTNRLGEAEPLFRRALAIDEASYGPDHPEVATSLNNLARTAPRDEPPHRGGAAFSPRAGDRRGELRAGSPPRGG